MSKAIWSGVVNFGLVSIPVKMHTAIRSEEVTFNQLHAKDNGRIKYEKVCAIDGERVSPEEIVKGYEYEAGEYVTLTEDDLKAVRPEGSKTVEILEFVELGLINPMLFDKPYYLSADKGGDHAYALLREALADSNRVAIARVCIRAKEHLAAVRAIDSALVIQLMNWANEIVEAPKVSDEELPEAELAMARMLLDGMTVEAFDASKFINTYNDDLLALIERKAAGEAIEKPKAAKKREKVVNIMDVLQASIEANAKKGKAA